MSAYHLVARTRGRVPRMAEPSFASRVWRGLHRAFPDALLALLMLDHVHVISDGNSPDRMRRRMARALAGSARGLGRGVWDPVPRPDLVREPKLARALRYVALNPCRKGFAGDPLEWLWSSYRDVFGATEEPWTGPRRLASRMGWAEYGFAARFHEFVSSDHTVSVDGTPLPLPAVGQSLPNRGLEELVLAVGSALRLSPQAVTRRGVARRMFVALAKNQGWGDPEILARRCEVTPRAARYLLRGCVDVPLATALQCLGDRRLTAILARSPWNLPRRPSPPSPPSERTESARSSSTGKTQGVLIPSSGVSSPWRKFGRRWLGLG